MNCLNCKSKDISKNLISTYKSIKYSICKNCGCHYQRPLIKFNYKSDEFWTNDIDPDGNIRDHTKERGFKLKNWYGDSINFVNSFKDVSVLDIGCGLGYFLSTLNNEIKKHGLEESTFALNYINKNFKDIKTIQGDIIELKKNDQTYDIIMFYHVLEHLYNPWESLKIVKSKLKKNGILILGTPLIGTLISNYFGKNYRLYNTSHPIIYNFKSLKKLLNNNSFQIFKIEKPFWKTDYNNLSNFFKLFNPFKLSPPYYGSIITLYCHLRD